MLRHRIKEIGGGMVEPTHKPAVSRTVDNNGKVSAQSNSDRRISKEDKRR
ncbi:hypothetical protein [Emticicia sp.]